MTIESFRGDYYFLSSMFPVREGIETVGNLRVPTVEHAYQASKFVGRTDQLRVLDAPDGFKAKKIADALIHSGSRVRNDWEDVKIEVMRTFVEKKFIINKRLGRMLLATGNEVLIEGNTWNDNFWGESPVGNPDGQNHLGKLLMETRDKLRSDTHKLSA